VSAQRVVVRYRRPPDREDRFEQVLVHRADDGIVTLLESARLQTPMIIDGVTVLEPAASIVWFTFPGAWHDVGRFHTRDGAFTGVYANVLTPVDGLAGSEWTTTDLFLDLWMPRDDAPRILDEDELEAAIEAGALDEATAQRARAEAAALLRAARSGQWPPAIVRHWTLEQARRHVRP
jgi:predicted RNA-binding protein associated with RNAse of E/G family